MSEESWGAAEGFGREGEGLGGAAGTEAATAEGDGALPRAAEVLAARPGQGCTWVPFYEEMADKLLDFKDDRPFLIELLREVHERAGLKFPKLEADGYELDDIDPFTVFGCFNKGLTDENRGKLAKAFKECLLVQVEAPSDFNGIPLLNNMSATFYEFKPARGEHDIDNLWALFNDALAFADDPSEDSRRDFVASFDRALAQKRTKWNLTMGLYWARPETFINLDGRNRWYIEKHSGLPASATHSIRENMRLPDGAEYLGICEDIRREIAGGTYGFTSFPDLSYVAWKVSLADDERERAAKEAGGSAVAKKVHEKPFEPSLEEYDPGLSTEDWLEILETPGLLSDNNFTVLKRMLDFGSPATCTELANKYGGYDMNIYRVNIGSVGECVLSAGLCEPIPETPDFERMRNWPVPVQRRKVSDKSRAGDREYRLRPELKAALEQMDLSAYPLYEPGAGAAAATDEILADTATRGVRYWLFAPGHNAERWDEMRDEGIMAIGWSTIGDLDQYESQDEVEHALQEAYGEGRSFTNSSRAAWQFAHEIQPGDVVFAKRGTREIVGRGVVRSDYRYDAGRKDYRSIRDVEWTHSGSWDSPYTLAQKTLTDITAYTDTLEAILALFGEEEEDDAASAAAPAVVWPPYIKEDFLADVYMDEERFDTLAHLVRRKKNVILQGAPGTGKTFAAKRLAYALMGEQAADRVETIQFHQSYSYEDFVEGFRPTEDGFELRKGIFYKFCKRAEADPDKDYFLVIDEINRGNLSKIFGELFMLVEADKRGVELRLLYSNERFSVPANVYLLGTMNTADRSLAMLDYALRRRFAFVTLEPGFKTAQFKAYAAGLQSEPFDALVSCLERLNAEIAEDDGLGQGFVIGHSFLCNLRPESAGPDDLRRIVDYELVPLLEEYWYDEPDKADSWAEQLRGACK